MVMKGRTERNSNKKEQVMKKKEEETKKECEQRREKKRKFVAMLEVCFASFIIVAGTRLCVRS